MGRRVFRNYYKGHMDKPRGRVESGEGGGDVWDGGECKQLYLNNKIK